MTQDSQQTLYNLSRRKMLAGLGAVGLASAGAGLGTSALFSDEEEFSGNVLTAGTLDLLVDYYSYWDQDIRGVGSVSGTADGPAVTASLDDMKPGDSGLLAFCFTLDDNPAYLWACGELTANDENGQNEPEEAAEGADTDGVGELADAIDVIVRYCAIADDLGDGFGPEDIESEGNIMFDGTLASFLAAAENGLPLDGAATGGILTPGDQSSFAGLRSGGVNPCLCMEWSIDFEAVGNEIQSDSLMFDLLFYAEQARHNDGTTNPCITAEQVELFPNVADDSFDSAFFGKVRNGGGGWELAVGNGDSPGDDDNIDYSWPGSGVFDGSFTFDYDGSGAAVLTLFDGADAQVAQVGFGDDGGEALAVGDLDGGALSITVGASSGQLSEVTNLSYNGGSPSVDTVESTGSVTSLVLSDINTTGGFALAGDIRFEGLGGGSDERPMLTLYVD